MSQKWLLKRVIVLWSALFLALNYVAHVRVQSSDAASKILDLRPFGYSADDIRAFSGALTLDGRMDYRDVYLPLDFIFIACSFVLIFLAAKVVAPKKMTLMVVLALVFVAADVTENLHVREFVLDRSVSSCFLSCDMDFWRAASATRIKFAALALSAAVLGWSYWNGRRM